MAAESIEMKIAKTAAKNWGQEEPSNLDEAKGITWESEEVAIDGIISILNIDKNEKENLMNDIYTNDKITENNATQIKHLLEEKGTSKSVINILSVIHDGWVKNNPNKFLQPDRNKEYQFSPLMLLNWKEANSDLLFLKPILEACNIQLDDKQIEDRIKIKENNIEHSSHEAKVFATERSNVEKTIQEEASRQQKEYSRETKTENQVL